MDYDDYQEQANLIAKFKALDSSNNKTVEKAELQKFLAASGFSKEKSDQIFEKIDVNHDGHVSLDEFLRGFAEAQKIQQV
jgi:Ca2+-binding EF-hand superfamily protein